MRAAICLASIGAAIGLALTVATTTPAAATDDSLPYWAPYRAYYGHGDWHCRRLFWHERCHAYRLGGYFVRNPDFRRIPRFRAHRRVY